MAKAGFFAELRRRHVVRVGLAYVVTAWLLIQLGAILLPTFGAPHWVLKALVGVLILLFPVALLLAWAFEVTPEGVRRTVPVAAEEARPARHGRRVGRVLNVGIIVVLTAAVGVLLWQKFAAAPRPEAAHVAASPATASAAAASAVSPKSIAVLPFESLSADKNNAYFAAGMQDMILTKLADIGDLKVMSRASTAKYSSHPDNLDSIARHLRVATFLEGSVQKAGNQVLINVQLIDARTDNHIWAQSYQRTLENIFGVEGEVAEKVAAALKAKLDPAEQARVSAVPTHNAAAYDAYLRAEHYRHQASDESAYTTLLPKAIADYRRAVKLDQNFALAWAGLASTQMENLEDGNVRSHPEVVVRNAEANARRALRLAPDLPEAHLAMATVYLVGHHDSREARSQLEQALKLRPNYADAVKDLGVVEAVYENDLTDGVKQVQRAFELDPNDSSNAALLAEARMAQGDYGAAREMSRRAIALAPNNADAYQYLSNAILLQTGDIAAALKVLDTIPEDAPRRSDLDDWRIQLLVMQKDYAAARRVAAKVNIRMAPGKVLDDFLRGYVEWAAGDEDKARPYLHKADDMLQARIGETPGNADLYGLRAQVLAMLGDRAEALQQIHKMIQIDSKPGRPLYLSAIDLNALAIVQVIVGDRGGAIDSLRKLMATGFGDFVSPALLRVDPLWDPLRKDPRFRALLRKYPLPPAGATASTTTP